MTQSVIRTAQSVIRMAQSDIRMTQPFLRTAQSEIRMAQSDLTPTGILVITSHGAPHTFKPLALEIEARGFRIVNPYLEGESYSPKGGERIAVYGKSTG